MFIHDPPGEDSHFMILPSDDLEAEIIAQPINVESMTPHKVPFAKPAVPNGSNPQIISFDEYNILISGPINNTVKVFHMPKNTWQTLDA